MKPEPPEVIEIKGSTVACDGGGGANAAEQRAIMAPQQVLPYIRFAPILALVGVGLNRIGKASNSCRDASHAGLP